MNEFITIVISGLVNASFYIVFGLGLALIYRSSGVLNFAQGAVGSTAAFVAFSMLNNGVAYVIAAPAAIVAGAVLSAGIYLLFVKRLSTASLESVGIMTLGVGLGLQSILLSIYSGNPHALPQLVQSGTLFTVGSYRVQAPALLAVGAAIAVTAILGLGLYRLKIGLAIRAVSEGHITASMFGIDPTATQAIVWGVAGALAGLAALLISPVYNVSPDFMTTYLIVVFATIVIGGFERIAGVVVGAIVFGTIQSLVATYWTTNLTETISFATILGVLVFMPYGIFGSWLPKVPEPHLPRFSAARMPLRLRRLSRRLDSGAVQSSSPMNARALTYSVATVVVVALLVLLLGTRLSTPDLFLGATIMATMVAVFGMDILYGYSGQLSIGQSGFMLLGAYASVLAQSRLSSPYLVSLVFAAAVTGVSGAIFGIPATRLKGVYLAVVTIVFALVVPELGEFWSSLTGGEGGIIAPLPAWLGSGVNRNYHIFAFALTICALSALAMTILSHSRQGRTWRAIRDNDQAAAAVGVRRVRQRVAAFAFSSAFCGVAGALLASITGYLTVLTFTLWDSIYLLVAVVVGGRASVLGCALGALFIVGVPYETAGFALAPGIWTSVAVVLVLLFRPQGVQSLFRSPLILGLLGRGKRHLLRPVAAGPEQ
jgi:ABC-type branched-subunit amino acid transport system permease subunit